MVGDTATADDRDQLSEKKSMETSPRNDERDLSFDASRQQICGSLSLFLSPH
jgi:hypothetical protein